MLKASIVRKTNSNSLNKLKKRLTEIRNQYVEIGYFKEQPIHRLSKLTLATLMYINEYGSESQNLPARPVFQITAFRDHPSKSIKVKEALKAWGKLLIKGKPTTNANMLDRLGVIYLESARSVFGDKSLLAANAKLTLSLKEGDAPLIDSHQLRDSLSYKNSMTKTLKQGG